jgi:hypothetical protein
MTPLIDEMRAQIHATPMEAPHPPTRQSCVRWPASGR